VPHRKKLSEPRPSRGKGGAFAAKKARLVRRVARGALFAVGLTALQYFGEDFALERRLFDHRVVDNLQAPLTHYHE